MAHFQRGFLEMFFAERAQVGLGGEVVAVGDFSKREFAHQDVTIDEAGFLFGNPCVERRSEHFLEGSFEGVGTHVGFCGELLGSEEAGIVSPDPILEIHFLSQQREEEGGKNLAAVVGTEQQEKFLSFHLVEVDAADAVFQIVGQRGEKFLKAGVNVQCGIVVAESFGDMSVEVPESEAVAEIERFGEGAADEATGGDNFDVAAGMDGKQSHFSGMERLVGEFVTRDKDCTFEEEHYGGALDFHRLRQMSGRECEIFEPRR